MKVNHIFNDNGGLSEFFCRRTLSSENAQRSSSVGEKEERTSSPSNPHNQRIKKTLNTALFLFWSRVPGDDGLRFDYVIPDLLVIAIDRTSPKATISLGLEVGKTMPCLGLLLMPILNRSLSAPSRHV